VFNSRGTSEFLGRELTKGGDEEFRKPAVTDHILKQANQPFVIARGLGGWAGVKNRNRQMMRRIAEKRWEKAVTIHQGVT